MRIRDIIEAKKEEKKKPSSSGGDIRLPKLKKGDQIWFSNDIEDHATITGQTKDPITKQPKLKTSRGDRAIFTFKIPKHKLTDAQLISIIDSFLKLNEADVSELQLFHLTPEEREAIIAGLRVYHQKAQYDPTDPRDHEEIKLIMLAFDELTPQQRAYIHDHGLDAFINCAPPYSCRTWLEATRKAKAKINAATTVAESELPRHASLMTTVPFRDLDNRRFIYNPKTKAFHRMGAWSQTPVVGFGVREQTLGDVLKVAESRRAPAAKIAHLRPSSLLDIVDRCLKAAESPYWDFKPKQTWVREYEKHLAAHAEKAGDGFSEAMVRPTLAEMVRVRNDDLYRVAMEIEDHIRDYQRMLVLQNPATILNDADFLKAMNAQKRAASLLEHSARFHDDLNGIHMALRAVEEMFTALSVAFTGHSEPEFVDGMRHYLEGFLPFCRYIFGK
jgi:hypothetical protein